MISFIYLHVFFRFFSFFFKTIYVISLQKIDIDEELAKDLQEFDFVTNNETTTTTTTTTGKIDDDEINRELANFDIK